MITRTGSNGPSPSSHTTMPPSDTTSRGTGQMAMPASVKIGGTASVRTAVITLQGGGAATRPSHLDAATTAMKSQFDAVKSASHDLRSGSGGAEPLQGTASPRDGIGMDGPEEIHYNNVDAHGDEAIHYNNADGPDKIHYNNADGPEEIHYNNADGPAELNADGSEKIHYNNADGPEEVHYNNADSPAELNADGSGKIHYNNADGPEEIHYNNADGPAELNADGSEKIHYNNVENGDGHSVRNDETATKQPQRARSNAFSKSTPADVQSMLSNGYLRI